MGAGLTWREEDAARSACVRSRRASARSIAMSASGGRGGAAGARRAQRGAAI